MSKANKKTSELVNNQRNCVFRSHKFNWLLLWISIRAMFQWTSSGLLENVFFTITRLKWIPKLFHTQVFNFLCSLRAARRPQSKTQHMFYINSSATQWGLLCLPAFRKTGNKIPNNSTRGYRNSCALMCQWNTQEQGNQCAMRLTTHKVLHLGQDLQKQWQKLENSGFPLVSRLEKTITHYIMCCTNKNSSKIKDYLFRKYNLFSLFKASPNLKASQIFQINFKNQLRGYYAPILRNFCACQGGTILHTNVAHMHLVMLCLPGKTHMFP